MSFCLQPFHVFSAILVEYIRKQQEMVIEYVQLENQVLREQIGGKRVLLNDDQRRLLAVKGKSVGRNLLEKTATIAQAETILRWHRELIEPNRDFKANHNAIGRPPVDQEIEDLVLRLARENESWGYKRIEGALDNLGFAICSSTVANILKKHGIEPAPSRKRTTNWSTFIKAHWDVFEGIDVTTIALWFVGLARVIFGCGSNSQPNYCASCAKSDEKTPGPPKLAIGTLEDSETTAHPARPPPIRPGNISFCEIRRAA